MWRAHWQWHLPLHRRNQVEVGEKRLLLHDYHFKIEEEAAEKI
jgi:hypothetical protein